MGLTKAKMQSHQIRNKTSINIDNIKGKFNASLISFETNINGLPYFHSADPGNVSLVINYTLSSSHLDSRHRSVIENKRRRKTCENVFVIGLELEPIQGTIPVVA